PGQGATALPGAWSPNVGVTSKEIEMRRARFAVVLGIAVTALLPGTVAAQTESPRHGGTLVVAIGSNPETLNPAVTTSVEALTVVVRFKKAYAPFLHQMTCQEAAMLPRHLYQGTEPLKSPRNADHPVGTGPFRWGRWVRGDFIEMTRNDQYFRPGLPYLDRVI